MLYFLPKVQEVIKMSSSVTAKKYKSPDYALIQYNINTKSLQ